MEYSKLIERIAIGSGLTEKKIEEKIDAKRTKLSGLISKEGAAQIVAAELGVSFEGERTSISELEEGMRRANLIGKITRMNEVREFKTKDREGKVASFLLGDLTGNVRVALWDINHINLVEKGDLKEGDVVEIAGASVRKGEVHLSGFSDIKKSNEKMDKVREDAVLKDGKFEGVKDGERGRIRAVIVQSFEPRYFDSKQKEGEKGVLVNLVLDDGTETMRAVLFNENIKKLVDISDKDLFDAEKFNLKREELIGEEKYFSGFFKMNSFSNKVEMSVNNVDEVDVDELVKGLEAKA
tara:strand:- start:3351 stop:4238 length:888 start_codon:yes stop_codon:yes gene_type:complete